MDYDDFLASIAYDKIADLSATTVALCLSAITLIQLRDNWNQDGNPLTDSQWTTIDSIISIGTLELMSSLVGIILPSVMATASAFKFIPCDGGAYDKIDYPLLYDAIDPVYIISQSQFRVPDMRDNFMAGTGGAYSMNDTGGANDVTLAIQEMPRHRHTYNRVNAGLDVEGVGVPDPLAVANPGINQNTSDAGGDEPHENRPPFVAVDFVIVAG